MGKLGMIIGAIVMALVVNEIGVLALGTLIGAPPIDIGIWGGSALNIVLFIIGAIVGGYLGLIYIPV